MPDLDILTQVHTDVKYIRENLENHIKSCEKLRHEVIRPLWEKHQQDKGAENVKNIGGKAAAFLINVGISVTAAWAAVKALR